MKQLYKVNRERKRECKFKTFIKVWHNLADIHFSQTQTKMKISLIQ